jgi:hypothetical protein
MRNPLILYFVISYINLEKHKSKVVKKCKFIFDKNNNAEFPSLLEYIDNP